MTKTDRDRVLAIAFEEWRRTLRIERMIGTEYEPILPFSGAVIAKPIILYRAAPEVIALGP